MSKPWTILSVLDWTRTHFESKGLGSPRLDAELILAKVLGLQRVMLYARFDQPLRPEELAQIRALVARRSRREPMAYLLEERELYGLPFEVTPEVLIPRPDTELLIDVALELLRGVEAPSIADVGTGSGCVAIVLAKELPTARVEASDTSPGALAVARRNAAKNGVAERVSFLEGDLLSARPAGAAPLHLVTANLPYIPTAVIPTLEPDVRDFEPRSALDGGPDGLGPIRRLVAQAPAHLRPGGVLALEIGHDQRDRALALLAAAGLEEPTARRDLGGHDRVVFARRRPA